MSNKILRGRDVCRLNVHRCVPADRPAPAVINQEVRIAAGSEIARIASQSEGEVGVPDDVAASLIGDFYIKVIGSGNTGGTNRNTGVATNETSGRASNKTFVEYTNAGEAWCAAL